MGCSLILYHVVSIDRLTLQRIYLMSWGPILISLLDWPEVINLKDCSCLFSFKCFLILSHLTAFCKISSEHKPNFWLFVEFVLSFGLNPSKCGTTEWSIPQRSLDTRLVFHTQSPFYSLKRTTVVFLLGIHLFIILGIILSRHQLDFGVSEN